MPEDAGGVAVAEAVETPVNGEVTANESSESITPKQLEAQDKQQQPQDEKQDNRRQPDALRKRIASLKQQAANTTDPIEKKALLDDAKALYDGLGKKDAYEKLFPTVREVNEVKSFLDTVTQQFEAKDWREGIQRMQATLGDVEQIDNQLAAGDPAIIQRLWDEAPDGIPKLIGPLIDKLAAEKPADYQKAITPHALNIIEKAGFLTSLDAIFKALDKRDGDEVYKIAQGMKGWFDSNRQNYEQAKTAKVDPEVERLRTELAKTKQTEESRQVESAYTAVNQHAPAVIDKALKPIVAKLGLSAEQYSALQEDAWKRLQQTRNSDLTYKTVAPAKVRQGYPAFIEYAKQWTVDNAETAAKAAANFWYGHQLKNGAKTTVVDPTKQPADTPAIQKSKEPPNPNEVDYGPRGMAIAAKNGYARSLAGIQNMISDGKAPLKAGGIRQWR